MKERDLLRGLAAVSILTAIVLGMIYKQNGRTHHKLDLMYRECLGEVKE